MKPTTGLGASYRFHLCSGARVALGLATFQLALLLVLVALQPPAARELLLKGLADSTPPARRSREAKPANGGRRLRL